MKSRIRLLFLVLLFAFCYSAAIAGSAQWDGIPLSAEWSHALNWTPDTVPNSASDIATFGVSTITNISVPSPNEIKSIVFAAAANSYTITAQPGALFDIRGTGIANNSSSDQQFVSQVQTDGQVGTIRFSDGATAGSNTSFTTNGGVVFFADVPLGVEFFDNSTAGTGSFTNNGSSSEGLDGGQAIFHGSSSADHATFTNNSANISSSNAGAGAVLFAENSTADHATLTNHAATLVAARGGLVQFYGNAKAGNATITNQGASGYGIGSGSTGLLGNSSAENATFINNGGTTGFADNATAANATLIANAADNGIPAGAIAFYGDSSGGTSQIKVYGDGLLEVSVHNAPGLTVGSIEGTGNIFLGSRNLTVGSNNRTIDFLGMIQEGGGRLPGGTLTKIGTGELALQGACTFPGLTTVNAGVLNVDGSLTGPVTVNGGKLVGFGSVGPVTINRGGRLSPGEDVGVLKVQGNLMMAPGSTYEAVLFGPTAGTTYNQANVAGKVNLSGSTLVVRLEYFPTPGTSYTIIKNDGKDAINGKFQGKAKFTVDGLKFRISYRGGDGNDVVLTALR